MEGSGIFNGDTGVIQSVNVSDKILTVLFDDGKKAVYNFDELGELEHAFALTIHTNPFVVRVKNKIGGQIVHASSCVWWGFSPNASAPTGSFSARAGVLRSP